MYWSNFWWEKGLHHQKKRFDSKRLVAKTIRIHKKIQSSDCGLIVYNGLPSGSLIKYSVLSFRFIDVIFQLIKEEVFLCSEQLGFLCIETNESIHKSLKTGLESNTAEAIKKMWYLLRILSTIQMFTSFAETKCFRIQGTCLRFSKICWSLKITMFLMLLC